MRRTLWSALWLFAAASDVTAQTWVAQGPGPTTGGQVEGMAAQSNPVDGAIHAVLAHPTDPNIIYAGSVNGGIWKTINAGTTWTPTTDFRSSLSTGALAFDPTDITANTLVAGIGRYSSLSSQGGARAGLLRTTDGGTNWTQINGGGILVGKNISGIAARGNTIVASVNIADSFTFGNIGIYRSINGGATFTQVSGAGGSGLPLGANYDLATDPSNNSVLYTSVNFADLNPGGLNGIYKSLDSGATWSLVSNAAMNALVLSNATSNIEISVGTANNVYAGIINNGQLAGLFRSGNGGTTWTQLDSPMTNESGTLVGLQPNSRPGEEPEFLAGGQGSIHFSILADPTNANLVYLGGDRQPLSQGANTGGFPNSLGANNFTGRLFKVNASLPLGSQASSLTHQIGVSTLSNSAPHADSRDMTMNSLGQLIEVDDGGIYMRTVPTGLGDWSSLNGNIRVTEFHSIAYDNKSNIIMGGTQDTGTTEQVTAGGISWREVNQGDGGKVAIDSKPAGNSTRYNSSQFLGNFTRRTVNASNVVQTTNTLPLNVIGGGTIYTVGNVQFYTTIAVNNRNANLYVGTANVFESADTGNTFANLGFLNRIVTSIEAGGRLAGVDNTNVLYVGTDTQAAPTGQVWRRTVAGGNVANGGLAPVAGYAGTSVRDLVIDDKNWMTIFVADNNQVFLSTNAGDAFADVTFNLAMQLSDITTLEFISNNALGFDIILAGGLEGVFYALTSNLINWTELGASTLPNAPISELYYDQVDDVLVVGTLGRGAFTFANASMIPEPSLGALLCIGLGLLAGRRSRSHPSLGVI